MQGSFPPLLNNRISETHEMFIVQFLGVINFISIVSSEIAIGIHKFE